MRIGITYSRLLVVLISTLSFSCDDLFNCLEGNGDLEKDHRIVSEFSGVINNTSYDVDITYNENFSIVVSADANLLDEITTSVRSGNLTIDKKDGRCIESDNYMHIDVQMPEIDLIELNASADMEVNDFNCNRHLEVTNSGSGRINFNHIYSSSTVDMHISGSGSITVRGKAVTGKYSLSGSGDLHASDLKVDECFVSNSASGNIYCYAYEHLVATITGSGNIYYSGAPKVQDFEDNGSGQILERN